MKFTRSFIKYLALFLIILLNVQNAFVISSAVTSNRKTSEKRNKTLHKKKFTSSKNKGIISSIWGFTCSFFGCSSVDKESIKTILNENVERKEALIAKIIKESNYFEKNLKDFTLYKISYFLGVLPPHLLQEPYSSVIEQYAYCFIEKEFADEKKRLSQKALNSFRRVFIMKKFYKKLKQRLSSRKHIIGKKAVSKLAAKLAAKDYLKINERLRKSDMDARDPQNKPLVKFLGRTSLLLPNKKLVRIPANAKMLTFTKTNDEFVKGMKEAFSKISECNSDKLKNYLKEMLNNSSIGILQLNNVNIVRIITEEFNFIKTGVRPNSEEPNSDKKSPKNQIEYSTDPEVIKATGKGRLLAISETLDLIADKTEKWKNISEQAADMLKNLKETAKMIKDAKDFGKNSDLIKDYNVVKTVIQKLDKWKFTKDDKLDDFIKVMDKYESKVSKVASNLGKVYDFTKTTSEIIKGVQSLSLQDRPSVTIYKSLILGANIGSIIPGLASQEFAITVARYSGEAIRDSEKLQSIIDKSVEESAREFEYSLSKGYLPFHVIVSSDFGLDSESADKQSNGNGVQEIKELVDSLGETAKDFVDPIVKEMESSRINGQIDRHSIISGNDFAMDVVSFESTSDKNERGIFSSFADWFNAENNNSKTDTNDSSLNTYDDSSNTDSSSKSTSNEANSQEDNKDSNSKSSDVTEKESDAEKTFNEHESMGLNPFRKKKKKY